MNARSILLLSGLLAAGCASSSGAGALKSWNEGPAKQSIVDFVGRVTKEGGPDYVPPEQRIAVFDNDGTLWAEQPAYFQLFFAMDRVEELAGRHPEWRDIEPFRSILAGDMKGALSGGNKEILRMVGATHAGMTTDEFEAVVADWTAKAKHPTKKRSYLECTYAPMVELLGYLRANGFSTYIVSGGGIDFMRTFSEKVYGIPPEQVIGSSLKTRMETKDGKPVVVKLPEVNSIDDAEGKPLNIELHIGRRPIFAFGNSDGDQAMLQWTAAGDGARFCGVVHHTDAEREWAYDRQSHIGKLDKLLDEATSKGWTVVDMKSDWARVFPD
jgi:phosphoserine phosphatase